MMLFPWSIIPSLCGYLKQLLVLIFLVLIGYGSLHSKNGIDNRALSRAEASNGIVKQKISAMGSHISTLANFSTFSLSLFGQLVVGIILSFLITPTWII